MDKICYKVCLSGLSSYVSAMGNELPDEYILTYKIGERTVPRDGRIFVFDEIWCAEKFLTTLSVNKTYAQKRVVFQGVAENVGYPKYLCELYPRYEYISKYWKFKGLHKAYKVNKLAPEGTLTCSAFTPRAMIATYCKRNFTYV
jgi:hypothetical protein